MSKPQKYWFKRRRYGYGWTPVTWQAWASLGVFLVIITGGTVVLEGAPRHSLSAQLGVYLLIVLIATISLIALAYFKGPKPKWRWGKRGHDNQDEDF